MQGFDRFVPLLQLGSVTARQLTAVDYVLMRLMPGGLMIFALHILRRWTAACMRVKAGQLQLELYPIYNNAAGNPMFMLDLFYSVVTSLYAWATSACDTVPCSRLACVGCEHTSTACRVVQ